MPRCLKSDWQRISTFWEKTHLVESIAEKQLNPLGVLLTLQLALYEYDEYTLKGMPESQAQALRVIMQMSERLLLEAMLKDCPGAVEQLAKMGAIEPSKHKYS
ncbi:MAG: hypothetical protein AB7F19_03545 [Candidatus Babeliales bacterium]